MERTLVLVKPDAVQRGLVGNIISRLEGAGLKLVALRMLQMDREMAERHYSVHQGKPFFERLVRFITSGPLVAGVFEGPQAVGVVRKLMGETETSRAAPGTIRGDLAVKSERNVVHGSDSVENAGQEISLFFLPEEVLSYERHGERWITES